MNFERPITPATTGPVSMPIRTSSGSPVSAAQTRDLRTHRERHLGDRLGMVVARDRHAAGDHVGVADRLDLLDAVALARASQRAKTLIEQRHDVRRRRGARRAA